MWIAIQNAVGARQGVGGGPGPTPLPYTPPLDLYPADIAYSVRKLSSSYSGPCMEVERVVDAATLDIGFDSNGLLDTQAIIDFLVAGGGVQEARVRTWYDQTGNSRHARQTLGSEMSYIYGGGSIREVNGKPVVDPIYGGDGLYNILGTYSTAANNTIFTVISPGVTGGSYVMSRISGAFTQGILGAGIEEPIAGWNSGIDFGFGTTQYYRDGALYGSGTTLQRNDIMQSVLTGRRIFGIGFTQSGLTEPLLKLGRDVSSTIYATQEYIVYFSDQLGTVPRTALEGNINSYYQVANLPDYTSGFLADYSGAAAAYSVRKLSNTAIKALRVRRTVPPYDELDIGFTPSGDLDEAAISAFGGSDVLTVSRWYDQSGFSRHLSMATVGSQPHIYDGASVYTVDGKPSVQFNGSDFLSLDGKSSSFTNWLESADGFSHYVVAEKQNNTTQFISGTPSAGSQTYNWSASATSSFIRFGGNLVTFNYINPSSGNTIFTTDYNDTTGLITALKDGELSSNSYTSAANDTYIFNSISRFASAYTGGVSEAIIYLSTRDSVAANIQSDINTYYGAYPTSGFLVDYPGSYRAYSLRKLQNLAQYAIRVQRHSGAFDEQDIGFTPSGDLDTQAIIDFAGTDVVGVKTWYNQVHRSTSHLTQSNTAYQPLIFDGTSVYQSNGKPAIYYDAGNKQLADTVGSGTGVNSDFFNVHQRNSGTGFFLHWFPGSFQVARMTTQYVLGWIGGTTGPALDTDQHVFTGIATGTTGQIRLDGTASTPGTLDASRPFNGQFAIQGRPGFPGNNPGPGDIYHQEFIQYDFNNTGADVTAIENDIKAYYSIP